MATQKDNPQDSTAQATEQEVSGENLRSADGREIKPDYFENDSEWREPKWALGEKEAIVATVEKNRVEAERITAQQEKMKGEG
jgi:hypothetical protein